MDDIRFRRVLDFFDLSWKGYRRVRKGVKKRLARYMQQYEFRGMEAFLLALDKDQGQRAEVERLLSVSISRFFRDRELWRAIGESVLPEIVSAKPPKVKVWSAGCARGEETYSFRILWEESKKNRDRGPELELWATDLNAEYLSHAQKGVYSAASLKEVPEEWQVKYFSLEGQTRWRISKSLGQEILWTIHNLTVDPPPAQAFHLIFLRNNLLTYYSEALKKATLAKVIESLSPGGFLIVGSHEKLPGGFPGVAPAPSHRNIYYYRGKE
jgi:chemotaxis methyl-accepting protein methylase